MNDELYDILCIMSSVLVLILILLQYANFTLCQVYILACIFSIVWRLYRYYTGIKDKNILFYMDLFFSIFAIITCCYNRSLPMWVIWCLLILMILSWSSSLINVSASNYIHVIGHYFILFYLLYCYLYRNR